MTQKIVPLGRRVLIEVEEKDKKVGSIYVPDRFMDKTLHFGTIIAVGEGAYQNGHWCVVKLKVGQRVMFRFAGERSRELDGRILLSEDEAQCLVVDVEE